MFEVKSLIQSCQSSALCLSLIFFHPVRAEVSSRIDLPLWSQSIFVGNSYLVFEDIQLVLRVVLFMLTMILWVTHFEKCFCFTNYCIIISLH